MIAFAVLFGLLAVFVAQTWLNSQAEQRMRSLEANKKPVNTSTIVVASRPLRFGNELSESQLREAPWPEASLPSGSFEKIADVLEVDVVGAQKLSLAASVGSLTLMLRKAGEANNQYTRKITLDDLGAPTTPAPAIKGPATLITVGVRRASTREEYSVPIEGTEQH